MIVHLRAPGPATDRGRPPAWRAASTSARRPAPSALDAPMEIPGLRDDADRGRALVGRGEEPRSHAQVERHRAAEGPSTASPSRPPRGTGGPQAELLCGRSPSRAGRARGPSASAVALASSAGGGSEDGGDRQRHDEGGEDPHDVGDPHRGEEPSLHAGRGRTAAGRPAHDHRPRSGWACGPRWRAQDDDQGGRGVPARRFSLSRRKTFSTSTIASSTSDPMRDRDAAERHRVDADPEERGTPGP